MLHDLGWQARPWPRDVHHVSSVVTVCVQNTTELSETVSHLGANGSWYRSQALSVGLHCGQEWWSGFRLASENAVKLGLTPGPFVPKPNHGTDGQYYDMRDLGSIVSSRPLASMAGDSDCYLLGYSVGRHPCRLRQSRTVP